MAKRNSPVFYRFTNGTLSILSSSGNWYTVDPDGQCNCPAYRKCWHQDYRRELLASIGNAMEKAGWTPGRIVRELKQDFPEIDR